MKRITDAEENTEDTLVEESIRPTTIDEYIGQSEVKENIKWDIWLFGHYHADRIERPYVLMQL